MYERENSRPRRVLLTGWFSFRDGEATAGDVLAVRRVEEVLRASGTPYDVAWSPAFLPDALHLDSVRPGDYSHLVFVCGPLHGPQVEELHRRFAHCVRIAVGTSVIDPDDPAARGFHRVLPRDAPGSEPSEDLAARAPAVPARPVVGVILTYGQEEYGEQRRHVQVADRVTRWLAGKDCARLELETRLDTHDWHLSATPAQVQSVLARLDLLVTDRLHGLVLALRVGTPVLAVDPVAGGAKVSAQARAVGWPALLSAEQLDERRLDRWWDWCLTSGRVAARQVRDAFRDGRVPDGADRLMEVLAPRATAG
ncbi:MULTISPECIES: polysaccharide pyruvyl transferase family protein [unclassified Streptomyces]|uniref:polysaccharide pyruvyl transferase family protein n=1 Tax=unclassified Streptomyces TaxID=2593676 RepID=UPI000AE262ED|nr:MULTISPECIES: polysaccharide pyruvyl transferase family protein [unclassified Streptomyces]AZM59238.1 polysaccharide pyruvyl transferase [Streptomyces sp. WAC 01438]RSM87246.1 polysaccharide pyruvyl transferase [Streptomyces sp. WAC 01420]